MLCGLGSVSESVLVDFLALYLVSKVSEKSGIGPLLLLVKEFTINNYTVPKLLGLT